MSRPQCALGKVVTTGQDLEAVKREGWQDQKILVVHADDKRLSWVQREFVKQIGEELYGEKQRR